MFRSKSHIQAPAKHKAPNKLILGFAGVAATAIIAAGGLAAAAAPDKPSKEQCKDAGFKNYGQCVKEWAHSKNRPGNGYGGGNTANVVVDLELNNSHNNIIQVIVNVFR